MDKSVTGGSREVSLDGLRDRTIFSGEKGKNKLLPVAGQF